MIGLDTNLLVRYFAQDDPVQSPKANALIESLTVDQPEYVTQVALIEVIWVLTKLYSTTRQSIAEVVEALLRPKELQVESAETVWKALHVYARSVADFADCLIERVCRDAQCEYTAMFDITAANFAGLKLIK